MQPLSTKCKPSRRNVPPCSPAGDDAAGSSACNPAGDDAAYGGKQDLNQTVPKSKGNSFYTTNPGENLPGSSLSEKPSEDVFFGMIASRKGKDDA